MTRLSAFLTAAILFGGVCLTLGLLGTLMIDQANVLWIYGGAVLGFASWVGQQTYRDCRAALRPPKWRRSV